MNISKRFFYWLFTFLALSFSLGGCRAATNVQPANLTSLTRAFDQTLPGLLDQYQTPGASVALVMNGELVWSQGYGLADRESGAPASADTVYQVASISKPVTAWGIMHLVEQGQLDLDAPVSRYLTRWKLPPSEYDPDEVTLRRLLSHSAGLNVHGYPGYLPDTALPSLEESLSGAAGEDYAVHQIYPAGQAYHYSGGGYTLLQLVIEEVSGEPFAEYMQTTVLDPLGLRHSSFNWRDDLRANTAAAYDQHGNKLPNYLFTEKAAAGLYTTAGDLALFGAAALPGDPQKPAGRTVLSPESADMLVTPAIAMPQGSLETFLSGMDAYGLGYYIETLPDGSHWYSHTGGNKGWRSLLILAPKQKAVLAVLTNSDNGSVIGDEITVLWANWLDSGQPKRVERQRAFDAGLIVLLLLFSGAFIYWLMRFVRGIWRGQRKFNFHLQWRRVLRLILALLVTGLWKLGGGDLLQMLFPRFYLWINAVVLLWMLALLLNALSIPVQPPRRRG